MSRVTTGYKDRIAYVTLARPDKHNALDEEMIEGIIAAGQEVADSDARAVVLSGAGASFCAGLDMAALASFAQRDLSTLIMERTHHDANAFQEVAMIWRRVPVPVIAAIHGACFGGGLQIALGADIRIAHPEARLSVMEMKWGLIPDMGGMALLPRLLRSDVLRRLTWTAEKVEAPQALDWGLVTELAGNPLSRANELAHEIAAKSPSAVRAAKRLIAYAESGASQAEVLLRESAEQLDLIGKPDQIEAVAAQLQKRPPEFT
ncbi:crotonase/enoyl-CoA hydratase family protein [Leisingera sp. SS27]|uniref:crotonase/enoyl-CoA hydratase family protein n=1 Tax=Leisingera sp. SS27 TaxID=2979462 RepID=UPI001792B552|nr:crotonase/enoyl-CoA hydratase family protein [Leisingera sp. SS27]MDC0658302.1 crotonase/enoyl-CoA hydratase family protein [Leisingera sp. SS27]NVK16727.1 crotonase/enoyl-CoA hydratase family protein [Paracoccaceae bacterium]